MLSTGLAEGANLMAPSDYLQRFWLYFAIFGTVVILLAAGVYVVETLPPRRIVMATGAQGGAYHELGIRYRQLLAEAGIELQLLQQPEPSRI